MSDRNVIERSDSKNPKSKIRNLKISTGSYRSFNGPDAGQSRMRFRPADGVQVRDEAFGLLFYNYRGPRLYFVPSKDLIEADFFYGPQTVGGLIKSICLRKGWDKTDVGQKITKILVQLEDKGLIYGQSIR